MRTIRASVVVVLLALVAVQARGDVKTFNVDPVHSSLHFRIRHLYTQFTGRFNKFSGTIVVDPDDLSTLTLKAEVDVLSIDTANGDRDKHLRAPDFFDTSKFATARFVSARTIPVEAETDTVKVVGKMTIRGKTKDVTFVVKRLGHGPDHRKGRRAGFKITTTIDRFDFGVSYGGKLPSGVEVLGRTVDLIIDVEAIEVEKEAAAAPDAQR